MVRLTKSKICKIKVQVVQVLWKTAARQDSEHRNRESKTAKIARNKGTGFWKHENYVLCILNTQRWITKYSRVNNYKRKLRCSTNKGLSWIGVIIHVLIYNSYIVYQVTRTVLLYYRILFQKLKTQSKQRSL